MIVTLTGNNQFLLKNEQNKLVNDFVTTHTDIGLEKYDGEELEADKLMSSVQAVPFLADKRMVVVSEGSANKQLAEAIDTILDNIVETTDLILVESRPDKRSSYYKTLKKRTDFREFNELDINGLSRWLTDEAKNRGGSISIADANYLVRRVGTSQMNLGNELEKLLNYDPKVTKETIELLTEETPQSTIFELLDAAFAGNSQKAIALYQDQRKQKVEPLAILAMIAWQLHIMAVVKAAGQKSAEEIAKQAKLNPFVVRKTQGLVRRLTLQEVRALVHQALELDMQLKSVSIDADEALQTLLLNLANKK